MKTRSPIPSRFRKFLAGLCGPILIGTLWPGPIAAAEPLKVAVSIDIPPYVMAQATRGVEVDLLRRALPDREFTWTQMDYQSLESAVSEKKADIAMSVQERKEGVFYSMEYIGFANFAISKKSAHSKIEAIPDLKGHQILTWEGAWMELGDEFKRQYAPDSAERPNYIEVADQSDQVRRFWNGAGAVIVIDRTIFDYFSEQQGHPLDQVVYHPLFPQVTKFRVAFADGAVREEFNSRLKALCESGAYERILKRYRMEDLAGVCRGKTEGK